MKRIFLIDNGCYSTKCSVINYDPSTATGTEEVRTFPTALDYTDGEYNIINEDNGGASIIRYFRAFFGMTKEAAQVKAEKLFPFMDFVYDNNGFAAISLSEGSNPVSCIELTREYVKKLYEKMNGDNKVDYVYFALPKEFDEETCNLYKREVRSCIHATCSFVSYTDLLLIAAERKQVLSVDIGASMLNVSLLRDNEVERTKSFILGSGYALDTAIVEFIKKEMGIVVNEEKRYVNVFLMQTAEKVRRTLDTAQQAQVDLTDISTFITYNRSIMTVRSNQLNTILGNYKKDLSFNIDLVRSIPGVDNSKSKLVLSGGMASQRFLKDCLGDLDKADEGLDKTLVILQSLTLFFKKDQNAPLLTLSSPAEESADSFDIDEGIEDVDGSNAPITPVSPVKPASVQPPIPAPEIPPPSVVGDIPPPMPDMPAPEIPPPPSVVDGIPPPPIPAIPSSPPEPDIPSPPPMPVTEFPPPPSVSVIPPPPPMPDMPAPEIPPPPSVVGDMPPTEIPPPPPVVGDMPPTVIPPPSVVGDMPAPEIPPPPSVVGDMSAPEILPPPPVVGNMPPTVIPPPSVVGDVPPPPPEPTMAMEIPPPIPEVPSHSPANEIPPPPGSEIPPPPPSVSEIPPPPPPPMPDTEVPLPPIPTISPPSPISVIPPPPPLPGMSSPLDAPPSPPETPPPPPVLLADVPLEDTPLPPELSFNPPPIPVLTQDSSSRSPEDLSIPPHMPTYVEADTGIPAPPPPAPNRVNDPPLIYSDPASSYRSTDSIQINSIPSNDVSEEVATPVNTQVPTPKPMSIMTDRNEIPLPMHPIQATAVKKTDKPVSSYGVDVPSEPRVRIPTRLTSVGEDSLSNQGESLSPPDSPLLPAEKGQSPPMVPKAPLVQNPPARPTSPPPAPSVITTSFASPSPTDSIQTPHPMSFTSPAGVVPGPTAVVVNDSTAPPSFYPISEKPQKPIAQSPVSKPVVATPLPLPQPPTPTHVDPIMPPPPPPPMPEPIHTNPLPPPPPPPMPEPVNPIMPPPPPPPMPETPKLEYDIVDEKGNIIFAKGSPLSQIASAEVKATFYQLVFRKEFFKMAEQKERLGTCICQLERGLRGGTVLHVDYVLKNGNISFQVTYNHNGKTVKEERTMKCSVC